MKPCPFCGGVAEIKQTGKNRLELRCTTCGMGRTQKWLRYDKEWLSAKMTEYWNCRAADKQEKQE